MKGSVIFFITFDPALVKKYGDYLGFPLTGRVAYIRTVETADSTTDLEALDLARNYMRDGESVMNTHGGN